MNEFARESLAAALRARHRRLMQRAYAWAFASGLLAVVIIGWAGAEGAVYLAALLALRNLLRAARVARRLKEIEP